jgi:acetyltransferase-like isoleucine patch superfamily enzyme
MNQLYIHPLADAQATAIGVRTRVGQFVVVLPEARIGSDCTVASHCLIENDVVLGDRVTVESGARLHDGLRIGNDVLIGPNVTFANECFSRSRQRLNKLPATTVADGASIGAGAVILRGLAIGAGAGGGGGAGVSPRVGAPAIVVGNPARVAGYTDAAGIPSPLPGAPVASASASRMTAVKLYQMPVLADPRGSLSVGEFERSIPFATKRYFMVFGVPAHETRGEHAHRECHQFLVCVHGSCTVLADDGTVREEFVLDRPDLGLHLPPLTWGVQYKYSPDAVLMVFASHYYDNADYIRDYSEFRQLVGAAT